MVDRGCSRIDCLCAFVLSGRAPRGIGGVGQRSRADRSPAAASYAAPKTSFGSRTCKGLAGAQHGRMGHPGSCGSAIPGTASPLQCAGGGRSRKGNEIPYSRGRSNKSRRTLRTT